MINIDEQRVDSIRLSLLNLGHTWAQANSIAVDMYIKEGAMKERVMKKVLADMERVPYNTAAANRAKRPTQTAWRSAHANV